MKATLQLFTCALRFGVAWCYIGLATEGFSQSSAELDELRINLVASASRVKELEVRLTTSERQVQVLNQALASANTQAKDALQRYENLRSALSGLGASAILEGGEGESAGRLLQALAELKASREQAGALKLAVQQAQERAAAPGADLSALISGLARVVDGPLADFAGVSQVVAVKPELGLAIVSIRPGQPLVAGARVGIQVADGSSIQGSVVEAREGSACVAYERGLGLNANVQVGSQVNVSVSNKL